MKDIQLYISVVVFFFNESKVENVSKSVQICQGNYTILDKLPSCSFVP